MAMYIELTQGKRAIVDDELFEELNKHKWYADKHGNTYYAARDIRLEGKRRKVYMHRRVLEIAGIKLGRHTDHVGRDGLDNRLDSIRPATVSQNHFNSTLRSDNTSGYKGIEYSKKLRRWTAAVQANGVRRRLGWFRTPEEAAAAYDAAASKLHGEFARLNTPCDDLPGIFA